MKEIKGLTIAITAMILISAGTYAFDNFTAINSWKVTSYSATLDSNGTFYEQYDYHISKDGKYHMLYRSWHTHVDYVPNGQCVIPVNMSAEPSQGLIGYSRSHSGEIRTYGGISDSYLYEKSKNNEVGFYAPGGFRAGDYVLNYTYQIYPNIYYDGHYYLLKFVFKDSGWDYGDIHIRIWDGGNIKDVRAPAFLHVKKDGNYWNIDGYDRYGMDIVGYIVMTNISGMTHAEVKHVDDVMEEVHSFTMKDRAGYYSLYVPYIAIKWTIYLFPAFFIVAYIMFGRERKVYGVERRRVTPPVRRKPWVVNLVFSRECEATDWNAFLATLLDLRRQGKVDINGTEITIKDHNVDDIYEKRVMDFLQLAAMDGKVGLKRLKETMKNSYPADDGFVEEIKEAAKKIRDDKELVKICPEFLWTPKKVIFKLMPIPIIFVMAFIIPAMAFRRYAVFYLLIMMDSLFLMFDLGAAYLRPSLLGRWKKEHYRERLEWDSFAKTISDRKFMKESGLQNGSLWEDWLIYGTALGIRNKVKKAMEEAGIDVSALYPDDEYVSTVAFLYVGGVSSSGGTGGVGGGGFGGGGAGAR